MQYCTVPEDSVADRGAWVALLGPIAGQDARRRSQAPGVAGGVAEAGRTGRHRRGAVPDQRPAAWWPERNEVDNLPAQRALDTYSTCGARQAGLDHALARDERQRIWGSSISAEHASASAGQRDRFAALRSGGPGPTRRRTSC